MNKKQVLAILKRIIIIVALFIVTIRIAVSCIPLNILNLEQIIAKSLPIDVTITAASLSFDGYNTSLKLSKVQFFDKETHEAMGSCKSIIVYPRLLYSLFSFDFKLNEIVFNAPSGNIAKLLAKPNTLELPVQKIIINNGTFILHNKIPELTKINALIILDQKVIKCAVKAEIIDGYNNYVVNLGMQRDTNKVNAYFKTDDIPLHLIDRSWLQRIGLNSITGSMFLKGFARFEGDTAHDNDVSSYILQSLKGEFAARDLQMADSKIVNYSKLNGKFAFELSDDKMSFLLNDFVINENKPATVNYLKEKDQVTLECAAVNLAHLNHEFILHRIAQNNALLAQMFENISIDGEVVFAKLVAANDNLFLFGEVDALNITDNNTNNYLRDAKVWFGFKDGEGKISVAAANGVLFENSLSNYELNLNDIAFDARVELKNNSFDAFSIKADNLHLQLNGNDLNAKIQVEKTCDETILNLDANINTIIADKLYASFPDKLVSPALLQALYSVRSGLIEEFKLNLSTRFGLDDFTMDKFELKAKFSDLSFVYTSEWPDLQQAKGSLLIHKDSASFEVEEANVFGELPAKLKLDLNEGSDSVYWLHIDGDAKGKLSALNNNLTGLFKRTLINVGQIKDGFFDLNLSVQLPLNDDTVHASYFGNANVWDARFGINDMPEYDITQVYGKIAFNNKLEINGAINGTWLGQNLNSRLETKMDGLNPRLELTGTGILDFAYFKVIHGIVDGKAKCDYVEYIPLTADDNHFNLLVTSNLSDVAINLPEPYVKKTKSIKKVSLNFSELTQVKQVFNFKYANVLDLDVTKDKDVFVSGNVSDFNVEKWQQYLTSLKSVKLNYGDKQDFFSKTNLDFTFKDLNIYGVKFPQTRVQAIIDFSKMEAKLSGPFILGSFERITENKHNTLVFKFDNLDLSHNAFMPKFTGKNLKIDLKHLPKIRVNINKLSFADSVVTNFSTVLEPVKQGYVIDILYAHLPYADLFATGRWNLKTPLAEVELKGFVNSDNFGNTFGLIEEQPLLKYGIGDVVFDLNFNGGLLNPQLHTLSGNIKTTLNDGDLIGVPPGFSRILNLFNIQNLAKRLRFNFRDLHKDDLTFDKLYLDVNFKQGIASIKTLTIDNAALKIACSGGSSLVSKNLDLDVVVTPNVLGSIPLAASIATGSIMVAPITMLVDKIWGDDISKMAERKYHVGGTWTSPLIIDVLG